MGEDQHWEIGLAISKREHGPEALVGVGGWHPDIDEDQIWAVIDDGLDQRGSIAHSRGYVVTAVRQDLNDPRTDHGRVFGDHHSQGRRPRSRLSG